MNKEGPLKKREPVADPSVRARNRQDFLFGVLWSKDVATIIKRDTGGHGVVEGVSKKLPAVTRTEGLAFPEIPEELRLPTLKRVMEVLTNIPERPGEIEFVAPQATEHLPPKMP